MVRIEFSIDGDMYVDQVVWGDILCFVLLEEYLDKDMQSSEQKHG